MPELPEVETVVRTLRPQIVNKCLLGYQVLHPKVIACGEDLLSTAVAKHAQIKAVERRAKTIILELAVPQEEKPVFLAFHLKMTGSFFVHPAGTAPLRHTRLAFTLGDCAKGQKESSGELFFDDIRTFGYCRTMHPEDFASWGFWQSLGPEPLEVAPQDIADRLQQRSGTIKAALLDQRVIAGIGNIYADEALFRAGISPVQKASSCSKERLVSLGQALQAVLQKSIEECGSSIRNYTDAFGQAGAFQNNFYVYGRKGECCRHCGTPLTCAKVAGRTTVYCTNCQPL